MLFCITYLYCSDHIKTKLKSIVLSTILSLFVWFLLAIPLAIFKFDNIWFSVSIYALLTLIAYYFITIKPNKSSQHIYYQYSMKQKLLRAVFAGSIITLAVYLSRTLGAFWGGIFSAFPAVYLSSLIILHWHHNTDTLFRVWKHAPKGSIVFALYALSAIYTFPAFGIWVGTIVSYAMSALVFYAIIKLSSFSFVRTNTSNKE